MAIAVLNNGSCHDSHAVDEVIRKLNQVADQGEGKLLVDLHRLSTPHSHAWEVDESQKAKLRHVGLLGADGTPTQIVKDVVMSSMKDDGLDLNYTGQPYADRRSAAGRAGRCDDDRLEVILNKVSITPGPDGQHE